MVDFSKLRKQKKRDLPTEPIEIFRRLPKKSNINDLWNSQAQALEEWYKRRNEKDLVLKLNTGGGKTLVGLIILQSIMNETKGRTLYLCPNIQLVEQTFLKAEQYGISAVKYTSGEKLNEAFLNGKSIMIATYKALFNGLSKFGLSDSIDPIHLQGIILDDAHTAFADVRESFTISIDSSKMEDLYSEITSLFRKDFKDLGKSGTFDDIVDGKDEGVLEVPYWSWRLRSNEIRQILSKHSKDFPFQWPLLKNDFDACHMLISKREVAITTIYPLIDMFPTFDECPRRIYMSATIADDSSIIRTFNADLKSVSKPIAPTSLAGVGERMILVPALMNIKKKEIEELIKPISTKLSEQYGVIILTPSDRTAETWTDIAEFPKGSAEVQETVEILLNNKKNGPFVFSNRYEGIDLPNDSCRVLIMADLPKGASTYDMYRAIVLEGSKAISNAIAQKVEQGLGRGTRGAGDYCVVILTGNELTSWISIEENLDMLTNSTNAQLIMGLEISQNVKTPKSLYQTILQCLTRDKDWVEYHAETLADLTETSKTDENNLKVAVAEREFFNKYRDGFFDEAISILEDACLIPSLDKKQIGWLKQLIARAFWYWDSKEKADEFQKHAFALNRQLLRPRVEPPYVAASLDKGQAIKIVENIQNYKLRRGYLTHFEEITSKLVPSSTANQFEESLKELGIILGFHAERPEKETGKGPDVLWIVKEDTGLILECKSRKKKDNDLTKGEHGQALTSFEWFKKFYSGYKGIKIIAHPNASATENASVVDTYALQLDKLAILITKVRELLEALTSSSSSKERLIVKCERLLEELGLTPESIISTYLSEFRDNK